MTVEAYRRMTAPSILRSDPVRGLDHPAPSAGQGPGLHLLAPVRKRVAERLLLLARRLIHHVAALEDAERGGELAQLVDWAVAGASGSNQDGVTKLATDTPLTV